MPARFALLVLCSVSLLIGCTQSAPSVPADAVPADAVPADAVPADAAGDADPAAPNLDDATLVALAAADAMDGEVDHIVSKCPGCSLLMGGKAEHSLALEDYSLHFCSATCREHFNADAAAGLAGLVAAVPSGTKK
jgi:hypothetical protein